MNYALAYRLGFHPWEDAEQQPAFVDALAAIIDEEEARRGGRPGTALDLGCGSAIWGIMLARRGWQVTGVDIVESALRRGAERVAAARAAMRLVHGDVTDLRQAGIGDGFSLVLDTGTFHGLGPAERTAMAREVDAVAAPDATVLLLVWTPRQRGPLPRGASHAELQQTFAGWEVTDLGASHFEAPGPVELLLRPDEHWYRLRRRTASSRVS